MANVNGVLNAIRVGDDLMEENILVGHGAGSLPTGSAVVGDVVEIARSIAMGPGCRVPAQSFMQAKPIPIQDMAEIETEYFLRFSVRDDPGVLSKISGILGNHAISIESVIQKGRSQQDNGVSLVIMVYRALERNMQQALKEIDQLDVVCEKTNLIRVEN
jgi:homoserine dehydrogenase